MTTLTFDTLAYAKKLKSVGFTEAQAEVHAETLKEIITEQLVTKEYLDLRLKELELRLKHDLTLRLGGMLTAGIAIVAAIVKLL
ncbi:MAG: DUF1640 domain-containing protein [Nitrospirae bacterium]|nr:DUF1640 domain-containing protein [Nitrospirota bacterium]MBF0540954.1 DUF1640 domain-containing protein [Nitrospirota bacterium]